MTTHDPTTLRPDRRKHISECPLRCGWRGEGLPAHIHHEHPLHPVCYECVECDVTTRSKAQATVHAKMHGGAEVRTKRLDADNYKRDHRKGYLRSIPKGSAKPRPEGWLTKTFKKSIQKTGPTRVDALWEWNGKDGSEEQRRMELRQRILGDAQSWRALDPFRKWRWLKTKAASEGWSQHEKVATNIRRRVTGRVCGRRCGWGDHSKSLHQTLLPYSPRLCGSPESRWETQRG